MTKPQWLEEFDNKFTQEDGCMDLHDDEVGNLKDFIRSQIEKARKEGFDSGKTKAASVVVDGLGTLKVELLGEFGQLAQDAIRQGYRAGLQKAIDLIPDSAGASYWHMKEILKSELGKK